jgi:hypothetical protein
VDAVDFMVKQLRGGHCSIEKIRESNDRLQFAEGEADKVMLEQLRELYHGPYEAEGARSSSANSTKWWSTAVDRARDAGQHCGPDHVLKHS